MEFHDSKYFWSDETAVPKTTIIESVVGTAKNNGRKFETIFYRDRSRPRRARRSFEGDGRSQIEGCSLGNDIRILRRFLRDVRKRDLLALHVVGAIRQVTDDPIRQKIVTDFDLTRWLPRLARIGSDFDIHRWSEGRRRGVAGPSPFSAVGEGAFNGKIMDLFAGRTPVAYRRDHIVPDASNKFRR